MVTTYVTALSPVAPLGASVILSVDGGRTLLLALSAVLALGGALLARRAFGARARESWRLHVRGRVVTSSREAA